MDFARPWLLYCLILLLPFLAWVFWDIRQRRRVRRLFLSDHAYQSMGWRRSLDVEAVKGILVTLVLALVLLAMAGPRWGEAYEEGELKGVQLMFMLDTSTSMLAEDIKPNRLTVAKEIIQNVLAKLQSDMVALVNFAAQAYVQCPLTLDYEAFGLMVEATEISPTEEQGTDLGMALTVAEQAFRSAAQGGRLLVLITDGEDQEGQWEKAVKLLQKQDVAVFAIGIGVPGGAPIPQKDDKGGVTGWKTDRFGQIVKTRLDEATLMNLAKTTNGRYFRLEDGQAVGPLLDSLKGLERRILAQQMNLKRIPRFQYPLALAIILLLFEMMLTRRKIQWRREQE